MVLLLFCARLVAEQWLRDGRVDRELHCHLIVVGENSHCVLITDHEIQQCCHELPWCELVSSVIYRNSVQVGDERAISVVRVQSELSESCIVALTQCM